MPDDQLPQNTRHSSIENVLSGEKDIEWRQGYVVVSTRRFQEILGERDRLLAEARRELSSARAKADDNARALQAFLERRRITRGQIDEEIGSAAAGYLNTCESGGMDPSLSHETQGIIEKMLNRGTARPDDLMCGVLREVEAERVRQVTQEGWSTRNDDAFDAGRLAAAAGTYALHAADTLAGNPTPNGEVPRTWSMNSAAWKPKNARRDLVRALALGVAELERMQRETDCVEDEQEAVPPSAEAIERDWLRRHRLRISREANLHPGMFFYSDTLRAEVNGNLEKISLAPDDTESTGSQQNAMGRAALIMCIAAHSTLRPGDTLDVSLGGTTDQGRDTGDFEVSILRKR